MNDINKLPNVVWKVSAITIKCLEYKLSRSRVQMKYIGIVLFVQRLKPEKFKCYAVILTSKPEYDDMRKVWDLDPLNDHLAPIDHDA